MMIKIFLSYSHNDNKYADIIYDALDKERDYSITRDTKSLSSYGKLKTFMESLREHEYVVMIVSPSYLRSFNCMTELVEFMKDDSGKKKYSERTLPVLVRDSNNISLDIFSTDGQFEILRYWQEEKNYLETKLAEMKNKHNATDASLEPKRREIVEYDKITENIASYMVFLTRDLLAPSLDELVSTKFKAVFDKVNKPEAWQGTILEQSKLHEFELIKNGIIENSYNDPNNPEFPPFSPRSPATPIKEISYHDRTLLIKDESYNITGTHKDRMAWEVVLYYKSLLAKKISASNYSDLPCASIISTGSAALAIQVQLRIYNLPRLKVLMDGKTDKRIISRLHSIGAEVYLHNLKTKLLSSVEILGLTNNNSGFDLTNRDWIDPNRRTYYDWLSYEIINSGAKWIFVPVGTGDLYQNILSVLRDEVLDEREDNRLEGGIDSITHRNVIGATTYDPKSSMNKLFAHHRPTLNEVSVFLMDCINNSVCSSKSKIHGVKEESVKKALKFATYRGISTEASGIAGLAAYMEYESEVPTNEKVLIVNTGLLHLPIGIA